MQTSLSWGASELAPILGVGFTTLLFLINQLALESKAWKLAIEQRHAPEWAGYVWIRNQKWLGLLLMGLIPWVIGRYWLGMSNADMGLTLALPAAGWYWILGCIALIIPLNLINARRPDNLAMYPQVRVKVWSKKLVAAHMTDWAAYLLGYEFLFRGFLLAACLSTMGAWTAIVVNLALYSLSHLPKGMKEAIGALPLGLVVCIATLQTGTIWAAYIIHLALAWANFLSSLAAHPEMRVEK